MCERQRAGAGGALHVGAGCGQECPRSAGVSWRGGRIDAAPGERHAGTSVHAPADRAGRQGLPVERGALLQSPSATGAGGAHVLPAAQRAAAAGGGALGQPANDPDAQTVPSAADAPAQGAVEHRRGLGAALCRPRGEAAVCLRDAGRDGATALAGPEPARPEPVAVERARVAVARGERAPAGREQARDSGRPAPGARYAVAAPAGLVHVRARLVGR